MAGLQSNPSNLASFVGRVAVITGGGGSLGTAIAERLARAGATVVIADIDGQKAIAAAEGLASNGLDAHGIETDVVDEASVSAAFASVTSRYGRLDVLVNNAGIAARRPSIELPVDDWTRVLAVNLTGTFLCSRAAARIMMATGGGAIVNVASIMGLVGNALYANPAYHASKGGIVNLTRAHAAEWGRNAIRVNAVAPTFVETELTRRLLAEPGIRDGILARTPIGGLAETGDVAEAVAYLSSDAAARVTGVVLPVDGGWTAC